MATGNFGGQDIGEYIEEKRKRAIRSTVILLMCLVLFCFMLFYWINSAKNGAASQRENEQPKQDTTINVEPPTDSTLLINKNNVNFDLERVGERRTMERMRKHKKALENNYWLDETVIK